MNCFYCNSKVKNKDNYCTNCGKKLFDDNTVALFLHTFNKPHKIKDKDSDYQRYITTKYKIILPREYHIRLIKNGYYNLIDDNYVLSEKGIQLLKEKEVFLKLYDNYDKWEITEQQYNKRKNEMNNNFIFDDVIWSLLNDKILKYISKRDYSNVRNMLLTQADFLEKEKKIPLYQYIEIALYDISLEYQFESQLKKENEFIIINKPHFIIKSIANKIFKYKNYYDKIDLKKIYSLNPMEKPISYEEFNRIINKILNNELDIDLYNKQLSGLLK